MTIKRMVDLAISVPALILLIPIFLLIGIVIRLDSPGPVFFRQVRIGQGGEPFRIHKFRTMVLDAQTKGGALTIGEDPRITRIGKLLRKYKIDELPQLFDVVRGTMSLVGPRPEVPEYVARYSDDQQKVLKLMPGITDPASIKYRNESELLAKARDPECEYCERILPDKIKINLEYAENAGVLSDIGVILSTLKSLVRSNNDANH
ncbi:MAG: sugar transferase [Gammaproteobacteria bacterium]|nr:MAG: sugar transferase [Gammaproteobacteria bacterium]